MNDILEQHLQTENRPIVAGGPGEGFTTWETGTLRLNGKPYRVRVQLIDGNPEAHVWLHGPRGGIYFLRPFLGEDNGKREVIRWGAGPGDGRLRIKGNAVQVLQIGQHLEEYVAPPREPR